jgi:hypothetical protein
MALRELLAAFSIDTGAATSALKKVDSSLDKASEKLGGLAEAFLGGATLEGMRSFISGQIEAADVIDKTSSRLGVSTEELQSFQFAADLAGVGAEEAGRSLGFLNKNIGEALGGNAESVKTFAALGVAIKDPSGQVRELGDVIPEVADAFAKMGSDQERTAQAMKLFGKSGAALIPLLKGGAAEIEKTRAEFEAFGSGLSKDFVDASVKTKDELTKLKFGVRGFKSAIALEMLPYVMKAVSVGQVWVKRLIKMSRETNLAKYAVVLFGAAGVASAVKVATGFAKLFGLFPTGNAGLLKTLASMGGFGLVLGLVLALALVFEDLWTGIQGGDSLIVGLIERFMGVDEATKFVAGLKEAWDAVVTAVEPLRPVLAEVAKSLLAIAAKAGPEILRAFVGVVGAISQAIVKLIEFFGLLDGEKGGKGVDAKILEKRAAAALARTKGVSFDSLPKVPAGQVSAGAAGAPVNVQQTNRVEVTVQGGATPQATGAAVRTGTKDALAAHLDDLHAGIPK